ncbi:DNA adenine methylase [Reyranella sp.]|uniref:DNA adenine methylase n=1 Tax=Reyranella sp. TaxID=1929291 RepID=UPI003D1462BF
MDGLEITRPAVRWYGGKYRLAPWIIGHFAPHRIYIEPFGGGGSVLLRKPRAYAEIYNDLDDWIVNLFKVLRDRDQAARLIELLRLTPFARLEFEESDQLADDAVENARRMVIRAFMGFGSNAHASAPASRSGFRSIVRGVNHNDPRTGFRSTGFRANSNRSGTTPAQDWANYPNAVGALVERLQGVVIEHRDAFEVMAQHDTPATLHYVDPPYLPETRSPSNRYDLKYRMYRHELTVEDHRRLLDVVRGLSGMVVLSGYPSDLYDQALKGWRRVTKRAFADGARERTEVLWLNHAAHEGLDGGPLLARAHA